MSAIKALWLIAGVILASPANCTNMGDYSSMYVDIWNDSTYMYGSDATQGAVKVHTYAVNVTLTSPTGRTITSYGDWNSGYSSNSVSLVIDYTEAGAWNVMADHEAYCTVAALYFFLGDLKKTHPTPTQYCQDGTTVSYCAEGNQLAPLGAMKSNGCHYYDKCCTAGGDAAPGWCRTETCAKCTGQAMDAKPTQCTNQTACNLSSATMCLNACH